MFKILFFKKKKKKTNLHIQNSIISNNVNLNKIDDGLIMMKNNLNIEITNSKFYNNESHSSGLL